MVVKNKNPISGDIYEKVGFPNDSEMDINANEDPSPPPDEGRYEDHQISIEAPSNQMGTLNGPEMPNMLARDTNVY